MSLTEWVHETGARVREDGVEGVQESVYELYVGALRRVNEVYPSGTNVYEREWDVLLLLDACRVDLMESVAEDYSFLDGPGTITSVGSSSFQWLSETFVPEYADEMTRTAYVTANPFSYRVLDESDLMVLDEVWRHGWNDDYGTIPARPVTDRAIDVARRVDPDRLVVHYMQPHLPSVPDPLSDGMNRETLGQGEGWESPWKRLRRGELDRDTVWEAYRANLEYVLDDVALLLENVDAGRVAISADHGNAVGERGIYGHPRVPLSVLREVPWYTTSASDERTYEPDLESTVDETGIEEKLSALGYA